jgi:hypothetical protein
MKNRQPVDIAEPLALLRMKKANKANWSSAEPFHNPNARRTYLCQGEGVQTVPENSNTTSPPIIFVKSAIHKHELTFPDNWDISCSTDSRRLALTIATSVVYKRKGEHQGVEQHE